MTLPLVPNLKPEQVARESYQACMAGKALRVNGLLNRLAIEGMRHQPLWLRREMVALMEKWVSRGVLAASRLLHYASLSPLPGRFSLRYAEGDMPFQRLKALMKAAGSV